MESIDNLKVNVINFKNYINYDKYLKTKDIKYLLLVVNNGYEKAYNEMGKYFYNIKDFVSAEIWFYKAIKCNVNKDKALCNIGLIYNIKKDYIKSKEYFKQSNIDYAKECYAKILFREKKFEEAYNIFIKFKTLNSYYFLFLMYANGFYVEKDIVKALEYLVNSKNNDWFESKNKFKILDDLLSYNNFIN